MPKKTAPKKLSGAALLKKVKTLEGESKEAIAIACGYTTKTKNGQTRVNENAFSLAMIEAMDIDLDSQRPSEAPGRQPTYRIAVHQNGNLLIGAHYTKEMELEPGDTFDIKLGRKAIQLVRTE
ncbi:MAG: AbrB family transcriptional regulator [Cyanobacteria bacterium J06642_2]